MNRRPRPYQGRALPAELPRRHIQSRQLSGVSFFESAQICTIFNYASTIFLFFSCLCAIFCHKRSPLLAVFFMDIPQAPRPMRLETAVIDSSALSGYKNSPSPCRGCPNFGRRWACPPFDTPPAELFSLDSLDAKIVLAAVLVEPQKNLSPLQCVEAARRIYDEIFYEVERLFPGCRILLAGSCICPLSQNCPRISGKKCAFEDRRRMSLESLKPALLLHARIRRRNRQHVGAKYTKLHKRLNTPIALFNGKEKRRPACSPGDCLRHVFCQDAKKIPSGKAPFYDKRQRITKEK